jgi:hypothetical protein
MAHETDAARLARRAADATIEAVAAGADPDELLASIRAAIAEGQRIRALRSGTLPAAGSPGRQPVAPPPGSAIARLLAAS